MQCILKNFLCKDFKVYTHLLWVYYILFIELFQIVSPKISERISGYALVAINLGIFSSTYVGGFVANIFNNNTPGFGIWTAAALIAILIIIQLVTIGVDKKAEDKYRQK